MAFGFGFNKTKVLSAAERFVQQGKLQAAIAEYEKIAKQDAKDLTVLNTVGDLYARLGHTERAGTYFRKVGDAYAADGFTVKAIAMYKKLTKLSPASTDCALKLAELYSQQGLYNDARVQYMQIADQYMKGGDFEQASRTFQKLLELDPDNTAMQARLAELYVRLGKKTEARDILFRAADSLNSRGARDAADDALARVLKIDPNNSRALMLRGQIALDAGRAAKAIEFLESIPDIDSLPDGLTALLRSYLGAARLEDAGPVARKLLTVHNDLSGIRAYADALVNAGDCEQALYTYEENADRLLAADPAGFSAVLRALIGRVKEHPAALEQLRALYQKAGDTTQLAEVTELLAHALVQSGQLEKARDLYRHLTEVEPDNELHAQNYRQILARLGQDTVARPLTQEEGAQPFMAEELEVTAPALDQQYPQAVADAVRAAITESELFDSYNLPAKAIGPLEAVLSQAPEHAPLNQRLASLYGRAGRFEEAARCCTVLERLYRAAGYTDEAEQYRAVAGRYAKAASAPTPAWEPAIELPPLPAEPPAPPAVESAPPAPISEFAVAPPQEVPEVVTEAAPAFEVGPPDVQPASPVAAAAVELAPTEAAPAAEVAPEIDLSDEWESELLIELPPAPTEAPAPAEPVAEPAFAVEPAVEPAVEEPVAELLPGAVLADLLQESRFYIEQAMWDEAASAIARCEELAPAAPEVGELKQQLAAGAAAAAPAPVIELVEEPPEPEPPAKPTVATLVFDAAALGLPQRPPLAQSPAAVVAPVAVVAQPPAAVVPPVAVVPQPPAAVVPPAPIVAAPPPAVTPADVLSEFTADLDDALGPDFALGPAPPPVAPPPSVTASAAAAAPALATAQVMDAEANSMLSDMFAEFKEEVEASDNKKPEDTETHYNLGVAFKEMGLLDEAIGELQKVCHAVDRGESFPHVMQAYTWLAQCFVEKGVPEAGVRWYEKALKLPGDSDTSTALHYDLARAHEAAGNRAAALAHFMEVYGTNIDYRDVAERIKTLKS